MKATFNQIAALILALADLAALMFVYYFPKEGQNATAICAALTSAFGMIIMFLVKASSDAKNADANHQMIDALKNSTPLEIPNPNPPKQES